ncbi:MAG: hypothetical protein M3Q00_06400 [Pseudomonadota bacterium]|nr:hypothetical protein [Pseudomonadota bacterium]
MGPFQQMLYKVIRAEGQARSARTVEIFGWIVAAEAAGLLFAPHFAAWLLHLPPLSDQAANYLRLVGLLAGGVGMLYIVSGRLNAQGFVFASLLDRPLVPPIMAVSWWLGIIPGTLALLFALSDGLSALWTFSVWRREHAAHDSATQSVIAGK